MSNKINFVVKLSSSALFFLAGTFAFATDVGKTVKMNEIDASGTVTPVGIVTLTETTNGVLFTPNLSKLPEGMHGFHLHEKPDCANTTADGVITVAGAAGGHWDPEHTKKHEGPNGQGHLGDLPALSVAHDGTATTPVLAPRIKDLNQMHGLALMVHAGGDNNSDHPVKLGGGGARIACGVVN